MEDTFTVDSKLLGALDADTRRDIIKQLSERQMTASELSRALKKHVTTVSEHLEVLQKNNLVQRIERPGHKWIYYKLTHDGTKLLKPTSYHWVFVLSISVLTIAFLGVGYTSFYQSSSMLSRSPEFQTATEIQQKDSSLPSDVAVSDFIVPTIILSIIGILLILITVSFLMYLKSHKKI